MTGQLPGSDPQHNWLGFQKATDDERKLGRQRYWQDFEQLTNGQRAMLGWGGALIGLGMGTCLAFAIYIFEKAHPMAEVVNSQGYAVNAYPSMPLTVFVILVASLAAGLGLAALGAALISTRNATARAGTSPVSSSTRGPEKDTKQSA